MQTNLTYRQSTIAVSICMALAGVSLGAPVAFAQNSAAAEQWLAVQQPLTEKRFDVFAKQGLHEVALANEWRVGVLSNTKHGNLGSLLSSASKSPQMGATAYIGKEWKGAEEGRYRVMFKAGSTRIEQTSGVTSTESVAEAQMWRVQTEVSYKHPIEPQWAVEPYAEWTSQHLTADQQGQSSGWALPKSSIKQHQTDVMVGARLHYEPSSRSHITMGLGWQQVLSADTQDLPSAISSQPQMRWLDSQQTEQAMRMDVAGSLQLTDNARLHVGYRVQLQAKEEQQSFSMGWTYQF